MSGYLLEARKKRMEQTRQIIRANKGASFEKITNLVSAKVGVARRKAREYIKVIELSK